MKLTGTVLRCSARKVNSSIGETYVTNLLVLDRENNSGANYAVEIWDDRGHELPLMSEVTLTVIGVAHKTGGASAFRAVIAFPAPAQESAAGA
jgi:hypothetical protein